MPVDRNFYRGLWRGLVLSLAIIGFLTMFGWGLREMLS